MDFLHTIFLLLWDGHLHLAPFTTEPARVLDVGTGTGIWALNFAEQYPGSMVVGTDLSLVRRLIKFRSV
jgi:ubiquinone/menaquinone biosynthesis C-methylase UbiE